MKKWNGEVLGMALLALVLGSATVYADYADALEDLGNKEAIVGGVTVKANDPVASSTVLVLGQEAKGQYICTGSIIDKDLIVTAAHCVTATPQNIHIIFALKISKTKQPDPSQVMEISGYLANPNFKGTNPKEDANIADWGDIALIHINGDLPSGYQPAELLQDESALRAGAQSVLAGYGITNDKTQAGAGTLRKVDVSIANSLGSTEFVIDQTDGKGACHGDSGGPAFQDEDGKLLLWGVTSRAYQSPTGACENGSVYTNIGAYTSWLSQAAATLRNGQSSGSGGSDAPAPTRRKH